MRAANPARLPRLAPWEAEPHRPWSLLEIMLSPFASRLIDIYGEMLVSGFDVDSTDAVLTPEQVKKVIAWSKSMERFAQDVGMPRTLSTLRRMKFEMEGMTGNQYEGRLMHLEENLRDDLEFVSFESIPANRVEFYGKTWGDSVAASFPSATADIQEAGTCFALGRFSAAVFHVVRASEHGLKALARAAGVKGQIDMKEWGKLIKSIEEKLVNVPRWNNRKWSANASEFYSGTLADARALKDCWRNVLLHVRKRKPVTEEDAKKAIERGEDFLKRLSSRITENQRRALSKSSFGRDVYEAPE